MSWLFGSSNGKHQCLFPSTWAEYFRNAPVLYIRERPRSLLTHCRTEKSAPAPEQAPAQPAQSEKPKPCCVCKPEKTARDDCMLFSKSDNPEQECKSTIEQYKTCMAGFGFKV
ncbi:hypothetical protein ACN42_g9493 [Penicillium freii]|uniref:Cytochrome c oxidase copper chaperone n=1 Tax=Penicillium freii TaxID=48697 RepID=A0A124GQC3_PENFR|nr:hypothetical protein ACN42_g9493 [Penicillium freii]